MRMLATVLLGTPDCLQPVVPNDILVKEAMLFYARCCRPRVRT